jgi:hypothetical protein
MTRSPRILLSPLSFSGWQFVICHDQHVLVLATANLAKMLLSSAALAQRVFSIVHLAENGGMPGSPRSTCIAGNLSRPYSRLLHQVVG